MRARRIQQAPGRGFRMRALMIFQDDARVIVVLDRPLHLRHD